MNLVRKTNTYYLYFLVLLFPIMIAVDYYLIQYSVNNEVNEVLLHESERIDYSPRKRWALPTSNYLFKKKPVSEDFEIDQCDSTIRCSLKLMPIK